MSENAPIGDTAADGASTGEDSGIAATNDGAQSTTEGGDAVNAGSSGVTQNASQNPTTADSKGKEIGGRDGLDPVRYGDWEKGGRCIDF